MSRLTSENYKAHQKNSSSRYSRELMPIRIRKTSLTEGRSDLLLLQKSRDHTRRSTNSAEQNQNER